MSQNSKIEWTHHTWNPWVGCTKISPACDHCYAEGWAKRAGRDVWGPHADRQRTKTQGNPIKWNKALECTGKRERVFVASLADVFDNHKSIKQEWRDDMWRMIRECPNLDFLLLTKRPQNIQRFIPDDWGDSYPNVWLGTTVENQEEADRRIPYLIDIPAKVRFLSCEPLVGALNLSEFLCVDLINLSVEPHWTEKNYQVSKLHWVITGGESGPKYRPADPDWFRSLRDQCKAADVPFLFKQWEGKTQTQIKALGRELDGVVHDAYPNVDEVF